MASNELEDQPVVAGENEYAEDSSDDAIPATKSGVRLDPKAKLHTPTPKFNKNDIVHAALLIGNDRIKGTFQVYQSQYNRERAVFEYQLVDPYRGTIVKNGAWIRERDLRIEKRG
ncbi:hypothetical protein FB567DRAFT_32762 [Paraphoma chrysanthemicola]|uniref:Uncharacterized protein n=1 Tax=Paraphoma chrysanthemicola TaxID=798071 RepID=A0A8K0W4D0_9PLEO|nr:hypothetical protein FB567DRAFT_32762 [Paraphoma chrysanthemicola]